MQPETGRLAGLDAQAERDRSDPDARAGAPFPRTSEMLRDLLEGTSADPVPLSDLIAGLRNRVLGLVMLLFALPCILPMPPGIPLACGVVLLSCGVHLALGRESLWLPARIARQAIARRLLETMLARAAPVAQRLERLCRPRWAWVTSRAGRAFIGMVVVVLAVILMLPIPFLGNLPPGVATAIVALGIVERDGVVILLGIGASVIAVAITSAMAWAAVEGLSFLV